MLEKEECAVEQKLHEEHVREEQELHREHLAEEEKLHEEHIREEKEFHHEHLVIPIFIDGKEFKVEKETLTGAELRNLPHAPIAADRDLWLDVLGPYDDKKVQPSDVIRLKPGMNFYTAPATINPGRA